MKKLHRRETSLLTFVGLHAAEGSAAGIAIAALLVLLDAGGVKNLMLATSEPYVALTVFLTSFASIVAPLNVVAAVMSIASDE